MFNVFIINKKNEQLALDFARLLNSEPASATVFLEGLKALIETHMANIDEIFRLYLSILDNVTEAKKQLLDGFATFILADPSRLEEYLQHLIALTRNAPNDLRQRVTQLILEAHVLDSALIFNTLVSIVNRFAINRDVDCSSFIIDNIFINSEFEQTHREELLNHFASAIQKADVDNRIHKRYLEAALILFGQQVSKMDEWFISIFQPDSFYTHEGSINALAMNKILTYHSKDLSVSKQVDNDEVKALLNRFILPVVHRLLRHPNVPSSRTTLPPFTREQCGEGFNVLMIASARIINMIPENEVKEVTDLLYNSLVAFIPASNDLDNSPLEFMPFGQVAAILTAIHNLGYVYPEVVSQVLGDPLASKSAFEDVTFSKRKVEMQRLYDYSIVFSRRLDEAERIVSFKLEEIDRRIKSGNRDFNMIQQAISLALLDHHIDTQPLEDPFAGYTPEQMDRLHADLTLQLEAIRRSKSSVELIVKKSKPLATFDDPRFDTPIWDKTYISKPPSRPAPRGRREDYAPKNRRNPVRPRDNSYSKY